MADDILKIFFRAHSRLVCGDIRESDKGTGGGVAGDCSRKAGAGQRSYGYRQDAVRISRFH